MNNFAQMDGWTYRWMDCVQILRAPVVNKMTSHFLLNLDKERKNNNNKHFNTIRDFK